jgi:hypothetical protein
MPIVLGCRNTYSSHSLSVGLGTDTLERCVFNQQLPSLRFSPYTRVSMNSDTSITARSILHRRLHICFCSQTCVLFLSGKARAFEHVWAPASGLLGSLQSHGKVLHSLPTRFWKFNRIGGIDPCLYQPVAPYSLLSAVSTFRRQRTILFKTPLLSMTVSGHKKEMDRRTKSCSTSILTGLYFLGNRLFTHVFN